MHVLFEFDGAYSLHLDSSHGMACWYFDCIIEHECLGYVPRFTFHP